MSAGLEKPRTGQACAACSAASLTPHLRVAGDAGPDGLIPTTDQFGIALSDIVRCPDCGHMQLERFPSDAELFESYHEAESLDYVEEEPGQRATAAAVLERIERHVAAGALLDIGSWVGYLLVEAQARGWRATGVEPSEFASGYARDRLGLDVVTGDLDSVELPGHAFDAVVLGDVIEHLPRPDDALDRIASLMAPGGVLCLMLPDAGSRLARAMGKRWWAVVPTHVQYFTRDSMRALLRRRGFTTLEVDTAPKTFTVRYYLGRIEGYSTLAARALVRAAEAARVADRLWAPDFGDRMLVLARGPA